MSLFGGEDSVSQSSRSLATSPECSPTPPNAQNPPLVSFTLDSDENDDFEDEEWSEPESDEEPSRPNRFTGKPQTWRGYTAADRQIAASLENIESADLAAHLYNAYNLKRRVRRPIEQLAGIKNWRAKDSWLRKGEGLDFTDPFGETQTELVPSKAWTAWPMPPKLVPVKVPGVGRAHGEEDTWYIETSGARDAGDGMREEVLALFMRQCKERWLSREYDTEIKDATPKRKSRAKSEAKGAQSHGSQSPASDIGMEDLQGITLGTAPTFESEREEKFTNILGKTLGHKTPRPSVKAAFLADDDEAQRVLQPSVDSLLSRLDSLALAVRRSRLNHFGRGAFSDRSGSEFTSDAESEVSDTRTTPRPRARSQARMKASRQPLSRSGDTSKNKRKPQKAKAQHFSDSGSGSDYSHGHGEETYEAPSAGESPPSKRMPIMSKKSRRSSASSSDRSSIREISRQYGLMDWSEVLGIASMTGWDQQAVARAAQRCVALFGEGMSLRTFDESLATEPIPEPVHYNPSTIPAPADLAIADSSTTKRPYFVIGTLRCPHKDCWGSRQDYPISYRVIEHVRKVHGYDPRTNDSENEERKVGGVHIDGFLQLITSKQGWVGGGRAKGGSKKAATAKVKGKGTKKQKVESGTASPVELHDSELKTIW
ncbi:hypothetical protein K458DRAFT_411718 [Lentithecium fluviatile CBS 122367]|uniref:Rrn9 domain-containing protein n=1 Tax=Lentithecium fluviatile CBS 122367 TaxID=1168545 RepID=A0A6G1JNB4_9PLEO|nr:hypothetical protein K458DRAFT_411718 [Lentithecium fluviatile CBS 122367]